MPESKKRKKSAYTPMTPVGGPRKKGPSPRWLPPLMLALFLIGIVWLVTYYVAQSSMPLTGDLGSANLAIGFGFIIAGFALSTQWR